MIPIVLVASLSVLGPFLSSASRLLPKDHDVLIQKLQKAGRNLTSFYIALVWSALITAGLAIIIVYALSGDLTVMARIIRNASSNYLEATEEQRQSMFYWFAILYSVPFVFVFAMSLLIPKKQQWEL